MGLLAIAAVAASLWPAAAHGPARPPSPATNVHRIAIFGSDDRVTVPPAYEALADKVGVLSNERAGTVCSAFCVAPAMVATAAHCVSQQAPGKPPLRAYDFQFARAYSKVRDFARVEGVATGSGPQHIMNGEFRLSVQPPIDAVKDWALVRLSKPICREGLPIRTLPTPVILEKARAGKVFQIAYHRDLPVWQPAFAGPCEIKRKFGTTEWTSIASDFEQPEQILLHTCDTGAASSGSPMFVDDGTGPAVVAMNVATYVQSHVRAQDGRPATPPKMETVANTAINARVFADQIARFRMATILRSAAGIRQLQEHLAALQFYSGRADGDYGPLLRAAIAAYETRQALPVTGLATLSLLERLDREVRSAGSGAVIPSLGAPRPNKSNPAAAPR